MMPEDPVTQLVRPLWRALHALGLPVLAADRRALGSRLFHGAPQLVQAVVAAARAQDLGAEAAALARRQEQAQRWAQLRDHLAAMARRCGDSYLSEQAAALADAEALLGRLREAGAAQPELVDAILLCAERQERMHPRRLAARRSTARREERARLPRALLAAWEHLRRQAEARLPAPGPVSGESAGGAEGGDGGASIRTWG